MWRVLLYAYLCAFGSILWLGWAVVQTVARGRAHHPPIKLGDPAEERFVRSNCFFWALRRFIWEGGTITIVSSPRLPVWRAEWSPPRSTERWHFEPTFPRRGVKGVWHTLWHHGKPKETSGRSRSELAARSVTRKASH